MICSIIGPDLFASPVFAGNRAHGSTTLEAAPSPISPAAMAPLPGPGRVRFVEGSTKLGDGGYAARQVRAFGEVASVLLDFGVSLALVSYLLPGPSSLWIAFTLTIMALGARLMLGRVPARDVEEARAWLRDAPTAGRVSCNGRPRKLARIVALGPIQDRMFEPQVFLSIGSTTSPRRKKVVQIVAGVLIAGIAAWVEWRFMHKFSAPYIIFLVGIGGAMLIGSAVYPTYLRVVPGRIDVMECALLGRRIIQVRRIDLRTRAVTMDVGRQMLHIDTVQKFELIPFAAIWDRWGFAHAVLSAAICTHTPPPLPDDELVG